jgi:hypothetical protein
VLLALGAMTGLAAGLTVNIFGLTAIAGFAAFVFLTESVKLGALTSFLTCAAFVTTLQIFYVLGLIIRSADRSEQAEILR